MKRRNWKGVQPTSLRHALELCKDHAADARRLSVERIAERMGEESHWTVYGWLRDGSIPARKIVAYEHACGCNFVTRWLAACEGNLLVPIPTGRQADADFYLAMQKSFTAAMEHLVQFYAGRAQADDTLAALTTLMEDVAWHHGNVGQYHQPTLELSHE